MPQGRELIFFGRYPQTFLNLLLPKYKADLKLMKQFLYIFRDYCPLLVWVAPEPENR